MEVKDEILFRLAEDTALEVRVRCTVSYGINLGEYVRKPRGEFRARGARCPRHSATSYILLIKYHGQERGPVPRGLPPAPSHDLVFVPSSRSARILKHSSRNAGGLSHHAF